MYDSPPSSTNLENFYWLLAERQLGNGVFGHHRNQVTNATLSLSGASGDGTVIPLIKTQQLPIRLKSQYVLNNCEGNRKPSN
jgi:hypothetical protein